jgi:Domain of unknown function (DUF6745)
MIAKVENILSLLQLGKLIVRISVRLLFRRLGLPRSWWSKPLPEFVRMEAELQAEVPWWQAVMHPPMPITRIEALTPEQEARCSEFVEKWNSVATCTAPADRPRAEAAIHQMYKEAGLAPPRKIVWCGSPLSTLLTVAMIGDPAISERTLANKVGDRIFLGGRFKAESRIGAGLADAVRDSVAANLSARIVGDSIKESVQSGIYALRGSGETARKIKSSIKSSVWASIAESIEDDVGDSIEDNDWSGVLENIAVCEYGQHDASSLAWCEYFSEVVGLRSETESVWGNWELAQSAGWALPHENICWISERHHVLQCDENGRLHSLTGPACVYPDGWEIHAIHGVRVPAFVVERPREITIEKIGAETNAEVRRIMIDRYCIGDEVRGAAAFMRDAGGKRVDHDKKFGTLWRREIRDDEPIVMLEVVNATRERDGSSKHYWLRVPPTMTTAREAAAWTFDRAPEDYAPSIET